MRAKVHRREFVTLLGGAAAVWPLAARSQPAQLPTIGFMGESTLAGQRQWVAAFVERLRELGWIEGRNVAIEYRWAEGASASPNSIDTVSAQNAMVAVSI